MDEPGGGLASEGGHPLLERGRALGESAGPSHSWERRPELVAPPWRCLPRCSSRMRSGRLVGQPGGVAARRERPRVPGDRGRRARPELEDVRPDAQDVRLAADVRRTMVGHPWYWFVIVAAGGVALFALFLGGLFEQPVGQSCSYWVVRSRSGGGPPRRTAATRTARILRRRSLPGRWAPHPARCPGLLPEHVRRMIPKRGRSRK